MKEYQECTSAELQSKLEQRNYWSRLHSNKLLTRLQAEKPARIIQDGKSQIISYYDEHLTYLCTIHRIVTRDGKVIHEDVKDANIDGISYRATIGRSTR